MKNLNKAIALCLSLMAILTFPVGVSAAPVADATIATDAKASLPVFKYDISAPRSGLKRLGAEPKQSGSEELVIR